MASLMQMPFNALGLRVPKLKLRVPSLRLPSPMVAFGIAFASYFLVLSGLIYDLIMEPPSIGSRIDPATGAQKPEAFLPGRINGQYITEGLTAGFMFCLGATGFILLDRSAQKGNGRLMRTVMLICGVLFIAIAYNLSILFIRTKVPNYLQ
eukprot:PLAT8793.1.p2 GENE.PLAT8793.1~~PLAT8793.1.p2  ORF type:complete len:151 (-),score=60.97 PLAT8793.1:365-817(-)